MKRTFRTLHNAKPQTVDIDLENCIPSGANSSNRHPKTKNSPASQPSTLMVAGTKHAHDPASDSGARGVTKLVIPVVSALPEDNAEEDEYAEVEDSAGQDDDAGSGIAIPPALQRAMDHLARRGTPISLYERSDASIIDVDAEESASRRPRSSRRAPKSAKQKQTRTRLTLRPRRRSGRETRAAALSRHECLCTVCRHPEREAIEEAFLHWHHADVITWEMEPSCSGRAIYRHARALGLYQVRSRNLRSSLEHIIEQARRITPSADAIIRAIRAYTRINENGEWIDPPTAHVVQVVAVPAAARALPALPAPQSSAPRQSGQRHARKTPARRHF